VSFVVGEDDTTESSPEAYSGSTDVDSGLDTYSNTSGSFTPPNVPTADGPGSSTSVDTDALDLFATNMDSLVQPVQKAATLLSSDVDVRPGSFYHANVMRTNLNGANADSGLKKSVGTVLGDLAQGITDIAAGVRALSAKYKTIDDDTTVTATDLRTAMQSAQADFAALIKDAGGSSGSGSGGTAS
jgi:hypothetical protein